MRKISILLSIVVLAAMLLSACGGEETNTAVPATDVPATDAPATDEATEVPSGTETVMPADGTTTPGIPVTGEEDPARLSNQLNFTVWNQDGEQIGEVNDIVLDLDNTRISYVIVGTGGFMELGERDILVPWNLLQTGTGETTGGQANAFILQSDQDTFSKAPDFDLNANLPQPGLAAGDWDADIRNYWENGVLPATASPDGTAVPEMTATGTGAGTDQATATAGTDQGNQGQAAELQGVVLASDVLGTAVSLSPGQGQGTDQGTDQGQATATTGTGQDQGTATPGTGTDVTATVDPALPTAGPGVGNFNGTIDDMIVDLDTGDILYIVLNAAFDEGERWIPVPLSFFQWDTTSGSLLLNVNPAMLRDAPSFQDGQFPNTTTEGWNSEFDTFWQNN